MAKVETINECVAKAKNHRDLANICDGIVKGTEKALSEYRGDEDEIIGIIPKAGATENKESETK
jgi:hypothetical protein